MKLSQSNSRLIILFVVVVVFVTLSSIVPVQTAPTKEPRSFERILERIWNFINNKNKNDTEHGDDSLSPILARSSNRTQVWLTVASVVNVTHKHKLGNHSDLVVRALEMHWLRPQPPEPGDHLVLYRLSNEPQQIRTYPLIDPQTQQQFPQYYKSDIQFDYQNLTLLNHSGKCLEYYLAYVNKDGELEATNCIRMNSEWMKDQFQLIKDRKLSDLMLPGTHDASSYEKYGYDFYEHDILNRFQFTQDESLYNQLAYGIRYMDFRVAVYNHTNHSDHSHHLKDRKHEEFWMVHDLQRNRITLEQALMQVKRFLQQTEMEIVIVDFHRFVHGFDGAKDMQAVRRRLQRFVEIVEEHLGQYLIPYSIQGLPSIDDLTRQGQRVLIGYQYKHDVRQLPDSPRFWPPVTHLWADTDKLSKLETYIEDHVCRPASNYQNGHHLRSVMAQLTPNVEGVLFGHYHGLRELAAMVNIRYEQWFRERWWQCTNIVAADFFLGSDLVQIAIDVNRRRFSPDNKTTTSSIPTPTSGQSFN